MVFLRERSLGAQEKHGRKTAVFKVVETHGCDIGTFPLMFPRNKSKNKWPSAPNGGHASGFAVSK
jgi:hypothetical protein